MRIYCLTALTIVMVVFLVQIPAEAVNKTKLILGSVLVASGAALSIHAAETSVLDDSGDAQFGAGIAVAGAGTTFLVLGLLQNGKKDLSPVTPNKKAWDLSVGVVPRRGGLSGGMLIRW